MRKFWGWVLFSVAWLDAGVIWYNTCIAPWRDDTELLAMPGLIYLAVLFLCLLGWYRLAVIKQDGGEK